MREIAMYPIGYVKNDVSERKDTAWGENCSTICLEEEYYTGLDGLQDFTHAIILYHLDQANFDKEKHLQRRPQNVKICHL